MPRVVKIALPFLQPFYNLSPGVLRPQKPSLIYSTSTHGTPAKTVLTSPVGSPQTQALCYPPLSSHTTSTDPPHHISQLENIPIQVCVPHQSRLLSVLLGQVMKLEVTNVGRKWRVPASPWVRLGSICRLRPHSVAARGSRQGSVQRGRGFASLLPRTSKCLEYGKFYKQGRDPRELPGFPLWRYICDRKTASGVGPGWLRFRTQGLDCPASTSAVPPARAWSCWRNRMLQRAQNDFLSFQGPRGPLGPLLPPAGARGLQDLTGALDVIGRA